MAEVQLDMGLVPEVSSTERAIANGTTIFESPDGKKLVLNPELDWIFRWIKSGTEFHTAPEGSEGGSPFAGRPEGKVLVAIQGKKMEFTHRSGILSFGARILGVKNPDDRRFIGNFGWWRKGVFSQDSKDTDEAESLKLGLKKK